MPANTLHHYVEHYFAPHPSQQVRELFVSKAILDFAAHSVMLFEPIYLHQKAGFSVPQVILFYTVLYVLYFFLLPVGGRICRRNGNERSILLSSPFLFIWYIALFAIPLHPVFIPIALAAIVIQKILYWPGYHADFAAWGVTQERGKEVSNTVALTGIIATLAPAFGGFIIATLGYKVLLIGAAVLILLSNIPLLKTPEFFVPQEFPYLPALKRQFEKANRRATLAFIGHGEDIVAFAVWPLFIAMIIPDTVSLGLVVSVAMLVNIGVILYAGRLSDEGDRTGLIRSGATFAVFAWLLRPLTAGSLGVFLMDSFYRISKSMFGIPLVASRYDFATGDHVMESIISFEMALALGKASAGIIAAAILWKFPDAWALTFGLAAAFTALYAFMPRAKSV